MSLIRFWLLYFKSFIKRYRIQVILSVVVVALGVALAFQTWISTRQPVISQGLVGTYTERDIPNIVTSLISKPLVRIDEFGQPQPELAESWSADKEVKVYTFKLKPNLTWSDGRPVKASEIAFQVPDVEIETPDDSTIIFKLVDSFSPFPTLLTKPIIRKDSFVGVGPYIVTKIYKDERNRVFVSRLDLMTKDRSLPSVVVRFYSSERVAKQAIKAGQVMSLIGVNDLSDMVNQKPFSTYSKTNYKRLVMVFYNTKDPILSDENYRLALSFAAPQIEGEAEAKSTLPEGNWAFSSNIRDYLNNSQQATSYLAKVKNGKDQPVVLTATSHLSEVGNRVVESWKAAGINAVLRVESGIPQNFQALLITQNIPVDPDQYSLWHSTQMATNISKISQPRIDKDLEDGRKVVDIEQRKTLYADFQKTLLDNAPATPLYFPKVNVVYLKKIEGSLKKIIDWQLSSY